MRLCYTNAASLVPEKEEIPWKSRQELEGKSGEYRLSTRPDAINLTSYRAIERSQLFHYFIHFLYSQKGTARLTKTDQDQKSNESKLKEENLNNSYFNQVRSHIHIFPEKENKYVVDVLEAILLGSLKLIAKFSGLL